MVKGKEISAGIGLEISTGIGTVVTPKSVGLIMPQ